MRRLWVVGAVMIAGLGCGDDGGSSVEKKIDRVRSELEKQLSIRCECFEEGGFDSRRDCIEEGQSEGGAGSCVQEAIEDDEGASAFLDCFLKAERAYTACTTDLTCDEAVEAEGEECSTDYDDAASECLEELSESAAGDFVECFE